MRIHDGGNRATTASRATGGRRRAPRWARIVVAIGAVLTTGSGAALVATEVLIDRATANIAQVTLLDEGPTQRVARTIDGPINLLLVGIDVRPGWSAGARADTILIAHIPATHDQAYLISIPRDWRVPIPTDGSGHGGGTGKINEAFGAGYQGAGTELEKRARGFKLLSKTLKAQTGIVFNGAALIDFQGFQAVVRELGGVDMCVDQRASSIHLARDRTGKLVRVSFNERTKKVYNVPAGARVVVHEKGCRSMPAELALDYARIRYGLPNTDYDRQRHQQQLIKAMVRKATSAGVVTDLGKLDRVIKAAGRAFILDTQGVPVDDFLFTLRGVAAKDQIVLRTNRGTYNPTTINGVSYELMSAESMAMLHAVRDGTLAGYVAAHPEVRHRETAAATS
ncbi:LCP family protein [Plantactinospora sp. GCM10030261]|uniref:LCP family protein n=1 Tax=Plantactinospora sp. GCM10030261 TaxID=3273420 RepID=UPI0036185897